ncbi:MurR/RpiR family transcriptional regulator [Tenuibacillus multivorans]|uniref:DNA-binding transcriptional regulator, MurR/RpiR family, contains HTH and SIS domains n=1 Tax=Tenuibacillus multivorans TaxID=237069 RepID=A0A1H0C2P1_9BACI|nr:MurR/RpiR family transcriptional regulator [Tenuibacillus multivorans]GEL77743.1 RpiR family transcriptional regulator [Tenuibacillus multivorans]SDN52126.1 DNA-binding transcriptional regulator, MurR/RpiR family, contains HTH and SIS domains [Tenuibacillus multivorans]
MNDTSNKHVLNRIRGSMSQFSEKEKKIATYILRNPQLIIHTTINQVADDLDIAEATVFRFCRRLDFKGYQAMKIALASEVVAPIEDIHEEISENDSTIEITEKVFQSNIKAIERTREIQNEESIDEATNQLIKANGVYFYGTGGSGVVAQDAQHKFMRLGVNAHVYTDTHLQLMSASQLTENNVAIFISHTGANIDILDVVEVAKENGVFTVAITNFAKSPLSEAVDLSLYTVSEETEYRTEALSSRIAELSIVDALYVNYHIKNLEHSKEAVKKMRKAISKKRL